MKKEIEKRTKMKTCNNISFPNKVRFRKKVHSQASDHVWFFLNLFSKRPREKKKGEKRKENKLIQISASRRTTPTRGGKKNEGPRPWGDASAAERRKHGRRASRAWRSSGPSLSRPTQPSARTSGLGVRNPGTAIV